MDVYIGESGSDSEGNPIVMAPVSPSVYERMNVTGFMNKQQGDMGGLFVGLKDQRFYIGIIA